MPDPAASADDVWRVLQNIPDYIIARLTDRDSRESQALRGAIAGPVGRVVASAMAFAAFLYLVERGPRR